MGKATPEISLSDSASDHILGQLDAIIGDKAELNRRYEMLGTRRLLNAVNSTKPTGEDAMTSTPNRIIIFPDGLTLESPPVGALLSPNTRVISPARPAPDVKGNAADAKPQ